MMRKSIVIAFFILAALAQIALPASMIIKSEHIEKNGIANKLKTAPIDPSDPFRGRYITLNFFDDDLIIDGESHWERGDEVFVSFENDTSGYAKIMSISDARPINYANYIRTKISYSQYLKSKDQTRILIDYPFDRFYMQESKAPHAERLYNDQMRDSVVVYGLLMVQDGDYILKDVIYDGQPINDYVRDNKLR